MTGRYFILTNIKKLQFLKASEYWLLVGGNSACDVAVEISRVAPGTCISMRRGYHIFPKFIFGKPTDVAVAKIQWMPSWLRQKFISLVIRGLQGRYAKYKLMKPDCGPLEIHPTINSELLYFIRHGKIHPRPGISRFEGNTVHFTDGTQGSSIRSFSLRVTKLVFHFLIKVVLILVTLPPSLYIEK